jgi:hypothetical protein
VTPSSGTDISLNRVVPDDAGRGQSEALARLEGTRRLAPMSFESLPSGDVVSAATIFFAFLIGHALGDYPLQSEFMVKGKDRHRPPPSPESAVKGLWLYCLSSHALIHAGIVWVITGSRILGFTEFVLHWLIDWLKVERKIGFGADQGLHISCKALYVIILIWWQH